MTEYIPLGILLKTAPFALGHRCSVSVETSSYWGLAFRLLWPQDMAKARQLLAEAGYPGGKGLGKPVINTCVFTAIPFLPESAQLAADS